MAMLTSAPNLVKKIFTGSKQTYNPNNKKSTPSNSVATANVPGSAGYSQAPSYATPTYGTQWQGPQRAPIAPITTGKTPINTGTGGVGQKGVTDFKASAGDTQSELEFLRKKQLQAIDEQYGAENSRLDAEATRAQDAYGQTIQQANAYYPEFQRLTGEQQASTESQIGNLESQRKFESERAMGQARQLLNDLNRHQAARMSATGSYGSSVPEAYAEQFGNKAYAAQSQIQQSRDTALNDLGQKRIEAKQYFDQKLFEGKQKYDTLITGLQQQLNAQLDQIGAAKGQASAAKRAQSLEAWNNFVNNKFSLDQELRQYQQQLTQFQAQTGDSTDTQGLIDTWTKTPGIDTSNTSHIMGQGQQTPNVMQQVQEGINSGGLTIKSPVAAAPKSPWEDPYAQQFA